MLTMLGEMLTEAAAHGMPRLAENIQEMHSTTEGAEMLRLIVRDDLGGAAELVTTALWG